MNKPHSFFINHIHILTSKSTSKSLQNYNIASFLNERYMKLICVSLVLIITLTCAAQTAPTNVKTAFAKAFPNVTVKKWDKEDGKYEANFTKDGKTMSATFAADGTLNETETSIKVNELPAAIADYVKANYKNETIKEAAVIVRGNKKMYEAEVKSKDLLFDMQGNFIKEEQD